MNARHFDIRVLSVEDERMPCETTLEFAGLGHLDPTSTHEDLPESAKVRPSTLVVVVVVIFSRLSSLPPSLPRAPAQIEVPLWLAEMLAKKRHVEVGVPRHYSERFREHLQAGPSATNLREKSPHYFAVGESLARMTADDSLQEALKLAYTGERFNRIMDLAFNSQHEDVTEEQRSFTDAELDLFEAGARATKAFTQWKTRSRSSLRTSSAAGPDAKRQKR
jgi:hypothetical protein